MMPTPRFPRRLAFEPNLILLDLMMPGIGGTELAGLLEANPKLKGVPIVFLTAAITKEQVQAVGGRIGKFPYPGQADRLDGSGRLSQADPGWMTRQ